jgi:hypothetical protein
VKGELAERPLVEAWNSFSYVAVWGDPEEIEPPFGFGFSTTYPKADRVRQLRLAIDAGADTYLTAFDGDLSQFDFFRYEVSYVAHALRPDADVLVVGSGGGRDLLAALAYGQRSILGLEVNPEIHRLVNGDLGDFTGHLDRHPRVELVVDEARSYLSRHPRRYDVIQVSLIDTWAATAAGAFVLTEHSLYTVEAWQTFLQRLEPAGVLSVSRWYFPNRPYETYRLLALASSSLRAAGINEPRRHIALVTNVPADAPGGVVGIATLLVAREPFTPADLQMLDDLAEELHFRILLSPHQAADPILARVVEGRQLRQLEATLPERIDPPTDDRPYFFFSVGLDDLIRGGLRTEDLSPATSAAVYVLALLLISVVGLAAISFLLPLVLSLRALSLAATWPYFAYFAAIGLGYLLVEVSQLQRFSIFLGHPTYAITVVLFTLLVSSGVGSYLTESVSSWWAMRARGSPLLLLPLVMLGFQLTTGWMVEACRACGTAGRILLVAGSLFPLGLFMGMAFPLGMQRAAGPFPALTPWLWAINGALSVAASTLAIVIALHAGISAAFGAGVGSYVAAVLVFELVIADGRGRVAEKRSLG